MAATNFTPISLYYSTTASAVPTAANLVPGELAINTNDGKLYYEDSSGVVQVLATKSTGSIGGSNTQVQFNNSGSLGGSSGLTWDGSFLTTSSIKNSALTSGRVTYAGASGLLSDNANFVFDGTNLGIGTPSPARKLHVKGGTGLVQFESTTSACYVYVGDSTSSGIDNQGIASTGNNLLLVAGGSERMRITSAGLVGIGTSSPDTTTLLTVAGAVTITGANSGHGASRLKLGQDTSAISQIRFYGADASTAGILQFTGSSSDGAVGAERMRIDSSGNLLVGTTTTRANAGDVQVSKGISFPATQSAQSDANTLDDYEEGTWNAVLSDGTNNATMAGNTCSYTKIGRTVTFSGLVATTSVSGLSGALRLTGLPFSVQNNSYSYGGCTCTYAANMVLVAGQAITAVTETNTTYLTLYKWSAIAGTETLQNTNWSNTGLLLITGTYITT